MNKKKVAAASAALLASITFSSVVHAFGAIAVDDEAGETQPGYGFATGASSKEEAKREAMRECRKSGNDSCRIAVWFKHCGAYAVNEKYYGYGYGDTKAVAKENALDMCGRHCHVVIARCE